MKTLRKFPFSEIMVDDGNRQDVQLVWPQQTSGWDPSTQSTTLQKVHDSTASVAPLYSGGTNTGSLLLLGKAGDSDPSHCYYSAIGVFRIAQTLYHHLTFSPFHDQTDKAAKTFSQEIRRIQRTFLPSDLSITARRLQLLLQ